MDGGMTYNQYPFLKELGLNEENNGCYANGDWFSTSGKVQTAISPHTNANICNTKMAGMDDYETCIKGMAEEKARW